MDPKDRDKLKEIFYADSAKLKLPPRADKVHLTDAQKAMIKEWTEPFCTTSAKCSVCSEMYSSGYLKVCPAQPTIFCYTKFDFALSEVKPRGYTDEELLHHFGIIRDEL
jgi:hypothetical protein